MARLLPLKGFKSISDIIGREREFEGLRVTLKNYNLIDEFEKIFPELKPIAKAVRVEKKILYLRVDNSVWKSELHLRKNILVTKINKYLNEEVIKTIKFL